MASNQQLSTSQSLVSKAMVKEMGNALIRLCDGIECHGLVDYQYGMREDRITAGMDLQHPYKRRFGLANMGLQFSNTS
jgi:hypothetical protein